MIKITRFFYIHWSVAPLFLLSYWSGGLFTLLASYAVVVVHELFHLFAALLAGERIGSILLLPFGMTLRLSAGLVREPGKEIFIALAGPAANLLMLAISFAVMPVYGTMNLSLLTFCALNIMIFSVNLLPCMPLDGGRVLKAVLVQKMGYLSAVSVLRRTSRVIIIVLAVLGVWLLSVTKLNVSLVVVAGFLAFHLATEQRQNEYILMREILYSKEKLYKKGIMRSSSMSCLENQKARDVFKMLSYDRFYTIHVVDKDQRHLRTVTEVQLVDTILKQGWQALIADVF